MCERACEREREREREREHACVNVCVMCVMCVCVAGFSTATILKVQNRSMTKHCFYSVVPPEKDEPRARMAGSDSGCACQALVKDMSRPDP